MASFYTLNMMFCCSVSVNCPLCEDGLVNADRRLILQAGHHGYKEEELDFEWRLYVIADGSTSVGKILVLSLSSGGL